MHVAECWMLAMLKPSLCGIVTGRLRNHQCRSRKNIVEKTTKACYDNVVPDKMPQISRPRVTLLPHFPPSKCWELSELHARTLDKCHLNHSKANPVTPIVTQQISTPQIKTLTTYHGLSTRQTSKKTEESAQTVTQP